MEPLEALNLLVARAVERTGARSEPAMFRSIRLPENYLYAWRSMLGAGGGAGPVFKTLLPLLEAAGVFATGTDAADDLRRQANAAREETDRLEAQARDLEAPQKQQRQDREEAEG